jgi:transcriptional regulator with XRE-family HTH domain
MSGDAEDLNMQLGARVHLERLLRGWSLSELAEASGVSRAVIGRIERGETSPTAIVLGRLSGALGVTLSTLLTSANRGRSDRHVRFSDQPVWRDPATGYVRRQIAPGPRSDLPLELIRVELPAGAAIEYPASAYLFFRHLIWVLSGALIFVEGDTTHDLETGDSLELGPPSDCAFRNVTAEPCVYVVAVLRP